jgi:proteic killer suppression protein
MYTRHVHIFGVLYKNTERLLMTDIFDVKMSPKATKDLKKVPLYIALKLDSWIESVGHSGLAEVKKIPGYHDEPLKGDRKGQRSIRLNIAYRAIYVIKNGVVSFVEIQEVNKHDY